MKRKIILYHGSTQIIRTPEYGIGNRYNDYGLGFYCTEELELAKEWACSSEADGFANKYVLKTDGLSILDLSCGKYHILNWLAILLDNRKFCMNKRHNSLRCRFPNGKISVTRHHSGNFMSFCIIPFLCEKINSF